MQFLNLWYTCMSIIVKGKSVQNATILLNDHVVMGQSNCHFDEF